MLQSMLNTTVIQVRIGYMLVFPMTDTASLLRNRVRGSYLNRTRASSVCLLVAESAPNCPPIQSRSVKD